MDSLNTQQPGGGGRKVLILGAGLSGLSAGWVLVRQGYEVKILERENHAGGLAVTKTDGEYSWDLGPHNIHTLHQHIVKFLTRNFSGLFEHQVTSQISKGDKLVSYPLQGAKVLTSLPPFRLISAGISFVLARFRMYFSEPADDSNFEMWIRNRFGGVLFNEYFRDYPAKVWQISPSQIDRYVAEKRIPTLSLTEIIRTALFGKASRIEHPEWAASNYYLPSGIGELGKFFERQFLEMGGKIEFNAVANRVSTAGNSVRSVSYVKDNQQHEEGCDFLLSTVPINDFVTAFDNCPAELADVAAGLDYVSSLLLFLKVSRRDVLPAKLLYFQAPEILFSRVSDVGGFSSAMVPEGKNLLCLEFPCSNAAAMSSLSDQQLHDHAVGVLAAKGLLNPDEVIGSFTERVSHSYPRFRTGFRERLKKISEFLAGYDNTISFGRQGGFAYVNTDSVINLGFHAAAAVLTAGSAGYGCSEWFEMQTRRAA